MAGEVRNSGWPVPKSYFSVQFDDDTNGTFQEVSGLQTESVAIEYRHGNSKGFAPSKMPGPALVGNVTLKKGIFDRDTRFFTWYNEIQANVVKRRAVVINLLDATGAVRVAWMLNNAWPTKITGADLKSDGSEVTVESIELAFESLEVKAP